MICDTVINYVGSRLSDGKLCKNQLNKIVNTNRFVGGFDAHDSQIINRWSIFDPIVKIKARLCELKSHLSLSFLISLHRLIYVAISKACNFIGKVFCEPDFAPSTFLRVSALCCQFLASLVSRWVWESESRNRVVCATEKSASEEMDRAIPTQAAPKIMFASATMASRWTFRWTTTQQLPIIVQ